MPLQLYGRHSLESYGIASMNLKVILAKTLIGKIGLQEMEDYCVQDVLLTTRYGNTSNPT